MYLPLLELHIDQLQDYQEFDHVQYPQGDQIRSYKPG